MGRNFCEKRRSTSTYCDDNQAFNLIIELDGGGFGGMGKMVYF
jgi:hypothetical protein